MKLKTLIKNLQEMEKEYGGDIDVIYASDDEGNSFHDIHVDPTPVERLVDEGYMSDEDINPNSKNINAIVVN